MNDWKHAGAWIAGGMALVATVLIVGTFALGDVEDPKGWRRVALVTGFWLAVAAGGLLVVRGALYLLRTLDRRHALLIALVAFVGILVAILLHNLVYAVTGAEEGFFLILAVFVGPVVLIAALARAFIAGRSNPHPPVQGGSGAAPVS